MKNEEKIKFHLDQSNVQTICFFVITDANTNYETRQIQDTKKIPKKACLINLLKLTSQYSSKNDTFGTQMIIKDGLLSSLLLSTIKKQQQIAVYLQTMCS